MAIEQLTQSPFTVYIDARYSFPTADGGIAFPSGYTSAVSSWGANAITGVNGTNVFFDNGRLRIETNEETRAGHQRITEYIFTDLLTGHRSQFNSSNFAYEVYITVGYDIEQQKASLGIVGRRDYNYDWSGSTSLLNSADNDVYNAIVASIAPSGISSNGGGATHIAKITGQLKDLSSNLSDILIVSGGGGGGLLVGETAYEGKEAGGISGSGDNSANQSTGNAFGLGESNSSASGGGGGLYGGYKGTSSKSGGAGSGYIGNSLVSNKKMVGYNVPTSDVESTKTESTTLYSAGIMSDAAKMGDGGARITFLRGVV